LFTSVCKITSQPFAPPPSQFVNPSSHAFTAQAA
jgi:hypothetical protein